MERGGEVRAKHVKHVTAASMRDVMVRNADRASRLQMDETKLYPVVDTEFASRETVNHGVKEYAR